MPKLAEFDEYRVLQDTIGDFDTFTPIVETDNPNSRVTLFKNAEDRAVYKSVFTKRDSHLKVIELDGGPPFSDATL